MKFKVDENLPAECALIFREVGFEAATVSEQNLWGAEDSVLFERCRAEGRVLVNVGFGFRKRPSLSSRISFSDCKSFGHPSHAAELVLLGTSFLPAPSVTFAMTADAKRNQVVYQIAAEPAPRFHVMDLHAFHGTALLTPPTISLQDPDSEFRVLFRAQFEPGLLLR